MNLSDTRMGMLFRCPHQYYLRYIQGIKRPPGVSAIVGRGVDETVNSDLTNKKDSGILLPNDQIKDMARDNTNREWESGVLLTKEEMEQGEKKIKGDSVDRAVRLANLHHINLAPTIKPVGIQTTWELDIKGYDVGLTGRFDILEQNAIRDTKTAKTRKTGFADKSMQLTMYALAGKVLHGKDYDLFLDYLVDTKIPKCDVQQTSRTSEQFKVLFRRIESAILFLEKGVFPPTNPEVNFLCSPKYCGYHGGECQYV